MKKFIHNFKGSFFTGRLFYLLFVTIIFNTSIMSAQKKDIIVRISEIEIYPDYLSEYKVILEEESSASVKLEPGVLAIFPMFEKNDATQIRILEIYKDDDAYQSHLKTPHFQKYKTTTTKMVKSLKLIDMDTIDPESMRLLFRKINDNN